MNQGTVKVRATRDDRIASLSGVVMPVRLGEVYEIRADILQDAVSAGCIPVTDAPSPAAEVRASSVTFTDLSEEMQQQRVMEAMLKLMLSKNPADFATTGAPRLEAVNRELGTEISEATRRECWKKFKEAATKK